MMNQTEQIIENYKNGDFEKRLNLFLECPSLRDTFQKIDQEEKMDGMNEVLIRVDERVAALAKKNGV